MARRSTLRLKIAFLVSCILFIAIVADASITWRKVTKQTSKPQISTSTAAPTIKSSTRSPITWRRSTIARRSTDAVESREIEDESDELEEANSSQEEHIIEQEGESEVKPLVPGSRPGFWFDSSRKKKPSSLLRPGTRRNSLFPTRSSTTTTSAPTSVSIAPLTVIPRTLPSVTNFGHKHSSSRIASSTRSTSSPIAFRKRFRTTKAARTSSTTNEGNQKKENKVVLETDQETENDMTENANETEDLKNIETETEDIKPIRPKISIRRRPYNSTRLSWIRKNDRKINRTTSIPQQFTTFASTSISANDKDEISAKTTSFPRTRTRSKTKITFTSNITQSRNRHTIVKTTPPPTNAKSSEESIETDSKSDNENHLYDEDKDSFNEENAKPISSFGSRQNSSELRIPKLKTTVEPFYLTRDYGRIATAMPELKNKKERVESTTQDMKTDKEITPTVKTKLTTEVENIASKSQGTRKIKKRIKLKTTEAPKQTTTIKGNDQDLEPDYDYEIIGVNTSSENISSFEQNNTIKERFESPIYNEERFSATLEVDDISTTTTRPATWSAFSTIDPNSNAYVVWSLGHGGSGWSYQKHGGQVKWSAQNSEAEGDNWSVVSRDEEENIQAALSQHWKPVRNSSTAGGEKSGKKSKIKGEISIPSKANTQKNISPVIYMPQLSFKNETILSFNNPGITNIPLQITNSSSFQFTPPLEYFGVKSIPNDNSTPFSNNLPQTFIQDPQPANFISQTPLPLAPTLENEFNEQVEGIINQYPIVPNYPYVAEIRETYKNLPESVVTEAPATKLSEIQKYMTVINNEDAEKKPTSPSPVQQIEPFVQEPQSYPYPQTEKALNYDKKISLSDSVISTQRPGYSSAIPPELAKTVVEAKKWQVIGHGGVEGWSLLNEDGLLEWKIHNVDGQWKVTSAEQLKEVQIPPQQMEPEFRASQGDNDGNSNSESYGYNSQEKQNLPKVWSLDDDYAKWRAVSAERVTPAGVSSEEISTSSQEYGYDSRDFDSDYYSEDDYYNSGAVNEDVSSFNSNEDYGSRPLWGDGENGMIYSQPKDYPQFSRNVEVANSREDAVSAWKSLVTQQGHWKFSDSGNEGFKMYSQHQTSASQNTIKTANRRTSTVRPTPEMKEKISHESSRGNTREQYVNQRNNRVEEKELTLRDRENNRNHKVQEFTEAHLVESSAQKQGQQRNIQYKQGDFPNVRHRNKQREIKNKTRDSNFESIIESLVQNYHQYRERDQPVRRLENDNYKQISKMIKIIPENKRYVSGTMREKYNEGNQAEVAHLQVERHINEHRSNDNNLQRDEYVSDTKYKDKKYVNSENENPFTSVQSYTRNEDRKNGGVLEPRVHINTNDHSKIESLITKLETVQKEAKGRAVIDISKLLKHIKSRRNTTSFHNKSDANYPIKSDNNPTFLRRRNERHRINNLAISNEEQNRQGNRQNLHRDIHYKLETDPFDKTISHVENDENNKYLKTNIRPIDYRNQHSVHINNHNQRELYAARSNNHSNENQAIKENIPLNSNSNIYPPARPTQQYRHERQSTTEKPEKDTRDRKRYSTSQDTYPKNTDLEETDKLPNSDSSSSAEIVVDLRDSQPKKFVGTRKRRPSRRRSRRPNLPQPIVLKGETEVEEDGSRKNRKIIVIDYAGTPKKKISVDKKDLELIIRNVKHRRSEVYEKHTKK